MIYRELVALAEREGLLEDTSYEPKEVHFLIHLGEGGRYLRYTAPRRDAPLGKDGRPKGRPIAEKRPIPRRSDRTAAPRAEFLVDKAEYVFGLDPDPPTGFESEKKRVAYEQRLSTCRRLFLDAVRQAFAALPDEPGLRAVVSFLEGPIPTEIRELLSRGSGAERKAAAGALFGFVYEPSGGIACVHDDSAVRAYFRGLLEGGASATVGQCLVTGSVDRSLTQLHAKPKGIPPKAATKGGVPLTSVNCAAFVSYGLEDVGGAPISREANVAIELALNRLLDSAYPRPDGTVFPKRHEVISSDTVVVYWGKEASELDFLHEVEANDPESVGEMLRRPGSGRPAPIDDPGAFFALILSGAQGRGMVRSFVESTVREVAANVDLFYQETRIVRPFKEDLGCYSLSVIRRSLVARGDLDRLPPTFATDLYLCALTGRAFKSALVESIVRRNRAELLPKFPGGERRDATPLAARCSLLRAYFTRNRKEPTSMALDRDRSDPPYLLGRLLAVVDRIQQDALENVNATIVDRFFGSASATPRAVMPTLIRRCQHHLGKLRREKPGLAVNSEKLLQEVLGGLSDFPAALSLEDQARFALGFYHQRQAFFSKTAA